MNMAPTCLQHAAGLVLMMSVVTNGLPTTVLHFSQNSPTSTAYLTSATSRTSTEQSTTTESSPTFGLTVNIPRIPARPVRVTTTTTTESPVESRNNRWKRFKVNKSTIGVAMGGGSFVVVAVSFIALPLRDGGKKEPGKDETGKPPEEPGKPPEEPGKPPEEPGKQQGKNRQEPGNSRQEPGNSRQEPEKKNGRKKPKKKKKRKSLHKIEERVTQSSVSTQTDHYIEQDESTRPDTQSPELIVNTGTFDNNPTAHPPQMSGSQLSDSQSLSPSPTPHPSVSSINTGSTPSQKSLTSSDDSPHLPPSPTLYDLISVTSTIASYSIKKVPVAPRRKPSGRQRSTIPTPELSPRRPLSAWGPPEPRECWQGPSGSYTTDNRQTKDYYYPVKNPWEWNRTP